MISGCRDDQTSADAYISNRFAGAMTWSFLKAMKSMGGNGKCHIVLSEMRDCLKGSYSQVPQLSSSKELNKDTNFF